MNYYVKRGKKCMYWCGKYDIYIAYLEKNWVIEKERIEVALILEDGTQRYLSYLDKYPNIEKRVAQHHIAAHLGITPTQLSRIRKNLK